MSDHLADEIERMNTRWMPLVAIPYAEASHDYVCKTSATTGRHVENFHITETTI